MQEQFPNTGQALENLRERDRGKSKRTFFTEVMPESGNLGDSFWYVKDDDKDNPNGLYMFVPDTTEPARMVPYLIREAANANG